MAKVLVVDDDQALSAMVADWLKYEKHEVTLVHCGFDGWKKIQTDEFDLAILDWDMPDLSGIDILKRYRDGGGITAIILLTGHNSADDKELGLDSGANDYLTKPFNLKELAARVRAVLRSHASRAPVQKPLGTDNQAVLEKAQLSGTALAANYEFLETIGEGGYGIVFKARHPKLDKLVAIKMLQATDLREEAIIRFEREARAISRMDHPNIIVVHDFGVTERKQPYMVMDFVDGSTLEDIVEKCEMLPLNEGLDILTQVCDGMAFAHDVGIIHRDIKPANIMLKQLPNRPPVPKILDFGLAKLKEASAGDAVNLTQAARAYGSPPYMSPEQVRAGAVIDERSDIYAMGCVIFEVLTGFAPFFGETAMEIMVKRLEEPPFTFKEARPELTFPDRLQEIVSKALEKKPDDRYQTMQELRDDLASLSQMVRASSGA